MREVLVRKVVELLIAVFGIFTLLFFLMRVTGDPAALILGANATTDQIESLRQQLELDRPVIVQYGRALQRALVLDFGTSLLSGQDALAQAIPRLLVSLQLSGSAVLFALVLALPIGVNAAYRRRGTLSSILMGGTYLAQATPVYVAGVLAILLFGVQLRLLPTFGWGSLSQAVLPVATLSLVPMAKFARLMKSAMLISLQSEYVRTAKSKGLTNRRVITVHALKNSTIATANVFGAELGVLVGSAVITESLFAVPGIGRMMVTAALARDYALVQAGAFLIAVTVVILNTVVNVAQAKLDPRLRNKATGA